MCDKEDGCWNRQLNATLEATREEAAAAGQLLASIKETADVRMARAAQAERDAQQQAREAKAAAKAANEEVLCRSPFLLCCLSKMSSYASTLGVRHTGIATGSIELNPVLKEYHYLCQQCSVD